MFEGLRDQMKAANRAHELIRLREELVESASLGNKHDSITLGIELNSEDITALKEQGIRVEAFGNSQYTFEWE